MNNFSLLLQNQRAYFQTGATNSDTFRIQQLKNLYAAINKYQDKFNNALKKDLNKAPQEVFNTEIGPALSEISFLRKNLREWMRPQAVPGMIFSFPSTGKIYAEPYGSILIIAPWNYPFWLSMVPLAGAIAAGNCVVLKPSEHAPATSAVMKQLLEEIFDPEYVAVVEGDVTVSQQLLEQHFDYIFFTGSTAVGKIIAMAAANHLIPCTLELSGKTPCIVDKTANIPLAAKRLLWGKMINSGQTCVAPDFVYVHRSVEQQLISEMKKVLQKFYPEGALNTEDYPRIINQRHYERLVELLNSSGKILFGGKSKHAELLIEPTIMGDVGWDDLLMKEEVFGPLLPVLVYDDLNEVIQQVNAHPKPLALYLFSNDKKIQQQIIKKIPFGGGLINDTIEHLGNPYLPFGGVGASGQGSYHGKYSFDTFSHHKSVMKKGTWLDLSFRYPPFRKISLRLARLLLR
ncbi:MAG: aldehyde dehydrogenase [Chitinophagaceae bacterium]|nr:aldehyde dehydrogenase [Chitinophagaceae bacterium]